MFGHAMSHSLCGFSGVLVSNAPKCGSGSKCRLEGSLSTPVRHLPHASPGRPSQSIAKKSQGGGGREGGRGGKAVAGGKAPPITFGGGGPSKRQLGPDPHLGALDILRLRKPSLWRLHLG